MKRPSEAKRLSAMTDDQMRDEVEAILLQIEADERRGKRLRMLVICCALMMSWILGASCALQAVPR